MSKRIEGYWEIETNEGDIWRLSYPNGGMRELSGIGLPLAQYVTQHAPGQHGSSHLGYVLRDRTIQMALAWKWDNDDRSLVGRRVAYPYPHLNYLVNPLKIRRRMPGGQTRELWNCWYQGGLEVSSQEADAWGRVEMPAVQFLVRDPVWYDPESNTYSATTATEATGDELIFDTPGGVAGATSIFGTADYLTFGSSAINLTLNSGEVTTMGDWFTFPTITIVGPAAYPEIENQTAGYEITMDYAIPAGRTVTIDLRYGYKTVTDDLGTNLAGYVPATDDLADFCLWPDPLAADGENDIRVFAGGATAATSITIAWYDRYLAI